MTTKIEEQWREDVTTQLKELAKAQNTTNVSIERLESRIIPRQEFEAAIGTRVSTEAFQGRMTNVETRIARLEGGPKSFRDWMGTILGIGGCLGMTISTVIGISAGIVLPIIFFIVLHH